jgi:hypothetical protein
VENFGEQKNLLTLNRIKYRIVHPLTSLLVVMLVVVVVVVVVVAVVL